MEWLEYIKGVWDDFVEFLTDLPLVILKAFLDGVAAVFSAIPVPDFMTHSITGQLGPLNQYIGYFLVQSGFAQGLALLAAGLVFRLTRKALTLGQW